MKIINQRLQIENIFFVILILLFFGLSLPSNAKVIIYNENESNVINNITAVANSNSEESAGESQAQVIIHTEINGEVVQDIDKSATGDNAVVEVKSKVIKNQEYEKVDTELNIIGKKNIEDGQDQDDAVRSASVDKVLYNNTEQNQDSFNSTDNLLILWWQIFKQIFINIFSKFK